MEVREITALFGSVKFLLSKKIKILHRSLGSTSQERYKAKKNDFCLYFTFKGNEGGRGGGG